MSQQLESMKKISVDKVVINIGVGKSGDPIEKAKKALLELTGQQPAVPQGRADRRGRDSEARACDRVPEAHRGGEKERAQGFIV
jgi:hypothetical protein